jgi:hypothetical protein
LHVDSFVELTQLRASCRRHCWPPSRDSDPDDDGDGGDVIGRSNAPPHCRLLHLRMTLAGGGYYTVDNNNKLDKDVAKRNGFNSTQTPTSSQLLPSRRRTVSPPSSMTFAQVIASSTVRTHSSAGVRTTRSTDADSAGEDLSCGDDAADSGSSPGSTVTATTVRTAIPQKSSGRSGSSEECSVVVEEDGVETKPNERTGRPGDGAKTLAAVSSRRSAAAGSRSMSRPAAGRPRTVTEKAAGSTGIRARSVSQCGGQRSSSSSSSSWTSREQKHQQRVIKAADTGPDK